MKLKNPNTFFCTPLKIRNTMKTNYFQSFALISAFLLLFVIQANAQNIYDFEAGFGRNVKQTYCKIAEVEGNHLARLFQDGSSIEFDFENVSEISFRYSAKKVGDNFSLILETRMESGKSWRDFPQL